VKGEGEHIRFASDKLWGDHKSGWRDRVLVRALSLLPRGVLWTLQSKSCRDELGAPEVVEANKEVSVKHPRGNKGCSSVKVTWPTAQIKHLYTNACSMGNKQEELEATVLLESYDLIALTET